MYNQHYYRRRIMDNEHAVKQSNSNAGVYKTVANSWKQKQTNVGMIENAK